LGKFRIEAIRTKNDTESFNFTCKHLILDTSYAPKILLKEANIEDEKQIAHCILITDKSFYAKGDQEPNEEVC